MNAFLKGIALWKFRKASGHTCSYGQRAYPYTYIDSYTYAYPGPYPYLYP